MIDVLLILFSAVAALFVLLASGELITALVLFFLIQWSLSKLIHYARTKRRDTHRDSSHLNAFETAKKSANESLSQLKMNP